MEIIANHKGGLKMLHEGYMYTKKYVSKTVRWECSHRSTFSCKGDLTTDAQVNMLCTDMDIIFLFVFPQN
jgi:hypothetical protein